MRRKPNTIRHIPEDLLPINDLESTENKEEAINEENLKKNSHVVIEELETIEPVQCQLDNFGIGELPDGTVVVMPQSVEDQIDAIRSSSQSNKSNHYLNKHNSAGTSLAGDDSNAVRAENGINVGSGSSWSQAVLASQSSSNSTANLGQHLCSSSAAGKCKTSKTSPSNNNAVISAVCNTQLGCTRCGCNIVVKSLSFNAHPVLNVALCSSCYKQYCNKSPVFECDPEDGKDSQCRWCCSYGDLFCCDVCNNSFCRRCIRRNLGRGALSFVQNLGATDLWKCYVCDPKPLEELRSRCAQALQERADFLNKVNANPPNSQAFNQPNSVNSSGSKSAINLPSSQSNQIALNSSSPNCNKIFLLSTSNGSTPVFLNSNNSASISPNVAALSDPSLAGLTPAAAAAALDLSSVIQAAGSAASASNVSTAAQALNLANIDIKRILSQAVSNLDNGIARSQGIPNDVGWLSDASVLNSDSLSSILASTLRTVASFYRDLHRLQTSLSQRRNLPVQQMKQAALDDFIKIYRDCMFNKLMRIPFVSSQSLSSHRSSTDFSVTSSPSLSASSSALRQNNFSSCASFQLPNQNTSLRKSAGSGIVAPSSNSGNSLLKDQQHTIDLTADDDL